MRFALLVQGSPTTDSDACDQALRFARAVVHKKHTLHRVFFYKDAVHIASDPLNLCDIGRTRRQAWLDFATQHQVELQVCVGASERRGISTEQENEGSGVKFEIVGLGQFIESTIECDRVIAFN